MTKKEKLRIAKANIARYYPGDKIRRVMYVKKRFGPTKCRQCGRCCVLFGIGTKEQVQLIADESSSPLNRAAKFILKHMVPITDRKFLEAHGVRENWSIVIAPFWSCTLLNRDGKCSRYEKRPHFCALFPSLGSTVPAECAFAGRKEYGIARKTFVREEESCPKKRLGKKPVRPLRERSVRPLLDGRSSRSTGAAARSR